MLLLVFGLAPILLDPAVPVESIEAVRNLIGGVACRFENSLVRSDGSTGLMIKYGLSSDDDGVFVLLTIVASP